jgi:TatD DNase family protein
LIDIGLNLASKKFANDWRRVLARAKDAGIHRVILTGTTLAGSAESAKLAEAIGVDAGYFTAGVHPHYSAAFSDDRHGHLATLRTLLDHPQAVAVGETGLDYNRDLAPRSVQRDVFEAHVDLACAVQKPLFLHERDAHVDLLAILNNQAQQLPRCVVHCFTGDEEKARAYLDAGCYLGITGWIGQKRRNQDLLKALPFIPRDRLMMETDAPYLTPPGYKEPVAGRNEPAALLRVAELLAEARGETLEQVQIDTYATTCSFFGLV